MKRVYRHLSILLSACLIMTVFLLPAGAESGDAVSYIVNEGSDIGMVNLQWNCTDGQMTADVVNDVSPYGKALSLKTGAVGCGWNNYKTGFVLPRGDNDLSKTEGFCFWVKVPDVGNCDPALDMFLWNTDSRCRNEFVKDAPIYYVATGSQTVESTLFDWGNYTLPLHAKSGWSGFVFIPYSSMQTTWGGSEGIDEDNLNQYQSFEMRVSVARTDDGLAEKTYVFDELGYYSDPISYIAYVEEQVALRGEEAEEIEYIANDGFNLDMAWSDLNESFNVSTTGTNNTGRAYRLYSAGPNANWYWAHFKMPHENVNISSTKGIAFYIKMPDDLDNCNLQVRLYIDDNHYYNDPLAGKNMYYLPYGSETLEEQGISYSNYPFTGKKGYDGWFFLPYSAMQNSGTTTNAAAVNAADNFQIQICVISGNSSDFGREYIVDQIGFYSDPLAYAAAATEGYGSAGDIDGNGIINSADIAEQRLSIMGVAQLDDKRLQLCDLNNNGKIDILDLIRIKKKCI